MRVGVVMLVNGLAIGAFQLAGGFNRFTDFAFSLGFALLILTGAGMALYVQPKNQRSVSDRTALHSKLHWGGLATIFALFVGQHGFFAFTVQNARGQGIDLVQIVFAMAACKTLAGLQLLASIRWGKTQEPSNTLLTPGVFLAGSVVGMALSSTAVSFFASLLVWELSLNVLSARSQATVVASNPALLGPWLTAAILSGAAVGPALNGLAIQSDYSIAFISFACCTAILPFLWATTNRSSSISSRKTN
jgi:hypothetical protein